ncbi:Protein stu1 [Penicillium oxalicum]|uniref:Protein stu1 n=1 Tax=Penicillium oxalicum TaxID=69781 RepID=UPI0020B66E55|nr:Protein stu1 [Penicillium oxalicum]KAI2790963.1 Protein stu1 [Penicillium oxalicum]
MEAKAAELLAAFKNPNVSIDAKVAHLTAIKSDIKQKNVPEGAIPIIFDTLRLALTSQHYSVLGAGFSTLGHFLKRLTIQDQQQWIVSQARNFYHVLLERLGDHKERIRSQAASIFTELWSVAPSDVEYYVLETALTGKNSRAREMSMLWLSNMTKHHGLLFRQYVPSLVLCLEDADSAVRDTARLVVVELFRNAPARAKSDLQKQLLAQGVRKSIANAILSGIGLTDSEPPSSVRSMSRAERPISVMSSRSNVRDLVEEESEPTRNRPESSRSHYDRSTPAPTEAPSRPKTPAAESQSLPQASYEDDGIEPLLVSSARDIDDTVRDMLPWFDGRESEDNWLKREKNVILFRRLTRGNGPHDFTQSYINGVKTLLDGIFKVVHSLRTTLCTNGCLLVQDIARTCGPKMDHMVEITMQNLMKLCGSLKKIAAQNGNATVDAVIGSVSYNIRILQHIQWASQDKNLQLRLFAAGWLQTLINRQANQKGTVEHGGGLDLVEKAIKRGLADANPAVREAVRSTFWTFHKVWPDRANAISSTLDAKSRTLLEKDSSNPNATKSASTPTKVSAGPAASRSALKEAIAARKRALPPSRPESAQSAFVDSDALSRPSARTMHTVAPLSSLSSAPMRPAMKPRRPEISRPATADPYARRPDSRAAQNPGKTASSPRTMRTKATTPSSKPATGPRLRPQELEQSGTTRDRPKKLDLSKSKSHGDLAAASRSHSESGESATPYSSTHDSHEVPLSRLDDPAPILPESKFLSALHPALSSHENLATPQLRSEHAEEPLSLRVPETIPLPASPHAAEPDHGAPLYPASPNAAAEPQVKSHPEPVLIYEDPASPVPAEPKTPQLSPSRDPSPSKPAHQLNEYELGADPVPVSPAAPETPPKFTLSELASNPILHNDGPNEARFPSPQKTPLRGTPSPTRGHAHPALSPNGSNLRTPSPPKPAAPSAFARSLNDENVFGHSSKVEEVTTTPRSVLKPAALEEMSLNESTSRLPVEFRGRSQGSPAPSVIEEPTFRHRRKWAERHRSPSPRSKDPGNAKEMLNKALIRINSHNMDISGYRKLQGLYHYHGDAVVSREEEYYAMLEALLRELEAAPLNRKDHDVKTQILATIRSMLLRTSALFHRYDVAAMASLIRARRYYESNSHFVTCLEEVAEQLSLLISPQRVIEGVLQGIEPGDAVNNGMGDDTWRSIIMGLATVHQALSKGPVELSDDSLARIGTVVSQQLGHARPGVRKQATELCTLLNIKFGPERVQKVTPPAGEGSLNLLTYFMARRAQ